MHQDLTLASKFGRLTFPYLEAPALTFVSSCQLHVRDEGGADGVSPQSGAL